MVERRLGQQVSWKSNRWDGSQIVSLSQTLARVLNILAADTRNKCLGATFEAFEFQTYHGLLANRGGHDTCTAVSFVVEFVVL